MDYTSLHFQELFSWVDQNANMELPAEVEHAVDYFIQIYESSLLGVLFYGSCLRDRDCSKVMDFHLLTDRYWCRGQRWWEALLNRLVSPNVYNMQLGKHQDLVQSKYAVYPLHYFLKSASGSFHPYIWARFAQPAMIAYAKDSSIRYKIALGQAKALLTFVHQCIPLMPETFSTQEFWQVSLSSCYAAELRPERDHTITNIYFANKEYFQSVTPLAFGLSKHRIEPLDQNDTFTVSLSNTQKRWSAILWHIRKIWGKTLSIIRLIKAVFTFQNPSDYIIRKLENHSGQKISLSRFWSKHPLLGSIFFAIRYYRKGWFK